MLHSHSILQIQEFLDTLVLPRAKQYMFTVCDVLRSASHVHSGDDSQSLFTFTHGLTPISNRFRAERMYRRDVSRVLDEHLDDLLMIYNKYANGCVNSIDQKPKMRLSEWIQLCSDAQLLTDTFTLEHAKLIFVLSNMAVVRSIIRGLLC